MGPKNFADRVKASPPATITSLPGKGGAGLATWSDGTKAAVKVERRRLPDGRLAQHEIPAKSHPQREKAFYEMAKLFGFDDLVPEVVLFDAEGRIASAQAWIPAEPATSLWAGLERRDNKRWVDDLVAALALVPKKQWLKLVYLDFVAGARDRHANNVGIRVALTDRGASHSIVAWDNAASFGLTMRFYKNVFHHLLFFDAFRVDPIWDAISRVSADALRDVLSLYLPEASVEHALARKAFVEDFPHRMPWAKLSGGLRGRGSFPAHEEMFPPPLKKIAEKNQILV